MQEIYFSFLIKWCCVFFFFHLTNDADRDDVYAFTSAFVVYIDLGVLAFIQTTFIAISVIIAAIGIVFFIAYLFS